MDFGSCRLCAVVNRDATNVLMRVFWRREVTVYIECVALNVLNCGTKGPLCTDSFLHLTRVV